MSLPAVKRRLTPREINFAMEYLVDLDATRAAQRAGYAVSTSSKIGRALEKDPAILDVIEQEMKERAKRIHLDQDHVVTELKKIAFANLEDFFDIQEDGSAVINLSKIERTHAAALSEITTEIYMEGKGKNAKPVKRVKIKPYDKIAALNLLMRHYGMEKRPTGGPEGGGDVSITMLINQAQGSPLRVVADTGGTRVGIAMDPGPQDD